MLSPQDARLLKALAAKPELDTPDATEAFLDSVPLADLASTWCALQCVSRRDQTDGIFATRLYFDHLPHRRPQATLDLILDVLKTESDKPTVMQLNDKLMHALLYLHGDEVIGRIEHEARYNERLRWLLGGVHFAPDHPLMLRIAKVAHVAAWRVDHAAQRTPRDPLDCKRLTTPELACAWIEQHSKADRDRDDNFLAIMDCERDLREDDPDGLIDLILEILKIETNPVLLSALATGPLEEVISLATIDRIEREARADDRFRELLRGVWYYRAPEELKVRMDVLVGGPRRR